MILGAEQGAPELPRARRDGFLERITPGSRSPATSTSKPDGSASDETRREGVEIDVGCGDVTLQLDVDVFGDRLGTRGECQTEADLGSGREPLGERHRQTGPAQGALPHPGRVAVAREAHLADLGGADAELHDATPAGSRLVGSNATGTSPPRSRSWPVPWLPPAGGIGDATTCSMP